MHIKPQRNYLSLESFGQSHSSEIKMMIFAIKNPKIELKFLITTKYTKMEVKKHILEIIISHP